MSNSVIMILENFKNRILPEFRDEHEPVLFLYRKLAKKFPIVTK